MKHIFIVNPTSGKKAGKKAANVIREEMKQASVAYEVVETEYAGHAKVLAAYYGPQENVIIYAVGGDGTIWEVINGLPEGVCMGILPCGTGNDYYRMIYNSNLPFKDLLSQTIQGRIVQVDYGNSDSGCFHNCTTMGLDAQVNQLAIRLFKALPIPRKAVYGIAALITVLHPKPFQVEITTESQQFVQSVLLAAVMNGKWYGGGFNPTPQANLQDGYFDICLIESLHRFRLLQLLPQYFKGKHTKLKECRMLKAKQVKFHLNQPIAMQMDGEGFETDYIDFTVLEKKLTLLVPTNSLLK